MSKEEKENRYENLTKTLDAQEKQLETLSEAIKEVKTLLSPKPPTTPTPSASDSKPAEHWKAEDLTDDCPECKREKEKIAHQYLQNLRKEREKEPVVCKNCGTGVKIEEENCPLCGGKDARKR